MREMREMKISCLTYASLLAALLATGVAQTAEPAATSYPTKAIQLIVPSAAGGSIDFTGRLIGEQLSRRWKVPVVANNQTGGGGLIAAQTVKRAAPDGYTLLMGNNSTLVIPNFVKTDLDAEKDLVPVAMVSQSPYFLYVSNRAPFKSVAELIAHAKANPGKLNFATIMNTTLFLAVYRFADSAGIKLTIVPYPAAAGIMSALLRDEVQGYIGSPAGMLEQVRSGGFRALAVGGTSRSAALPEVPLGKELGVNADFESWVSWQAVFAPAGTPQEIVIALSDALVSIVGNPEVQAIMRKSSVDPMAVPWQPLAAIATAAIRSSREVVRAAGIQPQ